MSRACREEPFTPVNHNRCEATNPARSAIPLMSSISFAAILLFLCCNPIVYSPHAQNEMLSPHNPQEQTHEIGAAFALNKWIINQGRDTVYIKTYPTSSVSLYHCAHVPFGKFNGFGGVELISLPTQWEDRDISGFFMWVKPFLGLQYVTHYFTGRLNLSPFSAVAGYGEGEWSIGAGPIDFTVYQISLLLHNSPTSKHTWFAGVRMSSGAAGFVVGGDYQLSKKLHLRTEYSYLKNLSQFLMEVQFFIFEVIMVIFLITLIN